MSWVWFAIVGYLCGSIPFGLLLTRMAGLGDVREIGSGNIGATNVLRTGNKKIAALTLLCDALKGLLPVLAATYVDTPHAATAAGFGALAGHIFPVWLKFKGGKGVATGLGVLFGWNWMLGLVFCAVWLLIFLLKKISSLSALTASTLTVAATFGLAAWRGESGMPALFLPVMVLAVVVFVTHRANIRRLLKGEEPKSSFSKSA
jgi:acyl phosphate:glycerol-3-phosphate acyltransferase